MLLGISVFSVAVLLAAGASIDPRCSRYNQGMEAQVLPYLLDCRKFVICDMGGNGQVLSCPKGLYFDVDSHTCSFDTTPCTHNELRDEGNDVVAPIQPYPIQPQPIKPQPIKPQPIQPQPILPQPIQPQPIQPQPIQPQPILPQPILPQPLPVYPKPILPIVPETPNFNPPLVAPEGELKPSETHIVPIVTVPITVAPSVELQLDIELSHQQSVCREQPIGNVFPVVNDCGLYVVCMGNNQAIIQRCPKGLLYDSKQQRCEFADVSICSTPRIG